MCSFSNDSIQNVEEIALQLPGSESKMLFEINKLQWVFVARPSESYSSFPCYQVLWTKYMTSKLTYISGRMSEISGDC